MTLSFGLGHSVPFAGQKSQGEGPPEGIGSVVWWGALSMDGSPLKGRPLLGSQSLSRAL